MSVTILEELGIAEELIQRRGLPLHAEESDLIVAETQQDGRTFLLTPATAQAWHAMKHQASIDGIDLVMISAFRSIERQASIIRDKLAEGCEVNAILEVCAPPGYSEHHTGRAIDIASIDDPHLEIRFELTPTFDWLTKHAAQFSFSMSYPRENIFGFQYEPWHWCFRP